MAYSLIHRTGIGRGRVYNAVGDNLTAAAAGAGTYMVGPWVMDYASLNATNTENYDREFSGIIMDGRQLSTGSAGDDDIAYNDFDEDEDLSDRGSIIGRDTKGASLQSVQVKLTIVGPTFEDARVWLIDNNDGTETDKARLDQWLDSESVLPTDGLWHPMRHALRVPLYWAIYKVKLGPNYESLAEMIVENSSIPAIQTGMMTQGPLGMLTALYGVLYAAGHATRLHEPGMLVPVARGYRLLSYDGANDDDAADPDYVFGDEVGTDDTLGIIDSPAQRARGRLYHLTMRCKSVRAKPDEILIWHVHTAPVRVGTVETPTPPNFQHAVVGSTNGPLLGPFMHLVYHECAARYRAR